jgi:hypothetical protein
MQVPSKSVKIYSMNICGIPIAVGSLFALGTNELEPNTMVRKGGTNSWNSNLGNVRGTYSHTTHAIERL